ncbi:MAG: hypothetical protein JO013_02095 [Alphaproteobacteria bacterium]|nr:hypothetical protein [Alphaproteobacteria bacterium]
MRSPCLYVATAAAALLCAGPSSAVDVAAACCVLAPGEHYPSERHPEKEDLPPGLLPAPVMPPRERALQASAEAPIERERPLVDAIGIPLDSERGVSKPVIVEPPASRTDPNAPRVPETDSPFTSPCCQAGAEGHPPDPHDTNPLVMARVKQQQDRALSETVEAPGAREAPLVNAIGVPLDALRGVSEPEHRPPVTAAHSDHRPDCCTADRGDRRPTLVDASWRWRRGIEIRAATAAAALLTLLMIAVWLTLRRRRPRPAPEAGPVTRALPDALPLPASPTVPVPEPEVARARARRKQRERETA